MVLRCSLLGHDYGEPEVDREREERGSEVVLTVQTYEECARCGDRHIISENTEVTSLTPDERRRGGVDRVGSSRADDPSSADRASAAGGPDSTANTDQGGQRTEAGPADAGGEPAADRTGSTTQDPHPTAGPDPNAADGSNANTDGGTHTKPTNASREDAAPAAGRTGSNDDASPDEGTLEGGEGSESAKGGEAVADANGRKPGEWPGADDVGPPTDGEGGERWPNVEIDRVGGNELSYDEREESPAAESPESPEAKPSGSEPGPEASVTDPGTGIASAASAPIPGENPAIEPADTEFYCPTCSFVAPGDHGSLRPGDICPDCGRGYLGERERN